MIGSIGLLVQVVISMIYFCDDIDEQAGQGAGDVVVEDGKTSAQIDPTAPPNNRL